MRKTKTESLKTRQYLLLAALEVFYRQGVTRCTLQEIAQEAGVTRGALYWHFKNKEELFEALFEQVFNDVMINELENENIDDAFTYLKQQLLNIFKLLSQDDVHYKFCNVLHFKCERTPHNETITALSEQYHKLFIRHIDSLLNLCHQQGKLPENIDLKLANIYLESSCAGLIKLWVLQPERFNLLQAAEPIIDNLLNNLTEGQFLLKS